MRRFHSLAGLCAAVVVLFMAITGAILSVQPALEAASAHAIGAMANVADLAGKVAAALPGVERITRSASGMIVAYFSNGNAHEAAQIDPATGAVLGAYEPSGFFAFITELHRSLFLGDAGHAVAGVASAAIAVLGVSGIFLLASRMGGWRRLFAPAKGTGPQRLHAELARVAVFGLALTALTGLYMSGINFGFVPDGSSIGFSLLPKASGGTPVAIDTLHALAATSLSDLRELVFPAKGLATGVFTLTTSAGQGYVDPTTGALLSFKANNLWQQFYEAIYMLHTGQGVWWLGLMLGAAALAVPAMVMSGVVIWFNRRRNAVRLPANAGWRDAETVILVGTEGNATLSFAASLHKALTAAGQRVHTAPMNTLRVYPNAKQLLVLTATYGDGGAPSSANRFVARLARLKATPAAAYAVLGFGDHSFAHYCAYADAVENALAETGMAPTLPFATIDRQSGQDFAEWGHHLGDALGVPLMLAHAPARPRTQSLVLRDRLDFGVEVQAPTAVLRFSAAPAHRGPLQKLFGASKLPRFRVGDLVGIIPPGSIVPRYYSLASASSDGELEICVRKQANGLCSEFLHGLAPGDRIEAFVKPNPDFHPSGSRKPLILVGAGSGIAPLAGFVRHNRRHRPAYMFFGGRDPQYDFLYRDQLTAALEQGRLSKLDTAFSRMVGGGYVQDRLLANADLLRHLIADGAQIFVCGGVDMARGVRAAIDSLLAPTGTTAAALKAQGRYFEDAY